MAKKKTEKVDGLSTKNKQQLRSAIRAVWRYSTPRRICAARCIDEEGFPFCEQCGSRVPKVQIDHIIPCGDIMSAGYIKRMFVSSDGLQGLCKDCHKIKTKEDREKSK